MSEPDGARSTAMDVLGCGSLDLRLGRLQRTPSKQRPRPHERFRQHAAALGALTKLREDLEADVPAPADRKQTPFEGQWDIRHSAFDAHSYLFDVHADSSHHELAQGLQLLQERIKALEQAWTQSLVHSFPTYLTAMFALLPELGLAAPSTDRAKTLEQLQQSMEELHHDISGLDRLYRELLHRIDDWQRDTTERLGDTQIGLSCGQLLVAVLNGDASAAALGYIALIESHGSALGEESDADVTPTVGRWARTAQRWAETRLQCLRFGGQITGRTHRDPALRFWEQFDAEVQRLWTERTYPADVTRAWHTLRLEVAADVLSVFCEELLSRTTEEMLQFSSAASEFVAEVHPVCSDVEPEPSREDTALAISGLCMALAQSSVARLGTTLAELWRYANSICAQTDAAQNGSHDLLPSERMVQCLGQFRKRLVDAVPRSVRASSQGVKQVPEPLAPNPVVDSLDEALKHLLVSTLRAKGVFAPWIDMIE